MRGTGTVKLNQTRTRKIVEPELKGEIRKNENVTATVFNPPGEDSRPLPEDVFVYVSGDNIGEKIAVGFLDTKNSPVSGDGEKRLYSRDSSGNLAALVYLKSDGVAEVNGNTDFPISHTVLQTLLNTFAIAINANFTAIAASLTSLSPPVPYAVVPVSIDITTTKITKVTLPSP